MLFKTLRGTFFKWIFYFQFYFVFSPFFLCVCVLFFLAGGGGGGVCKAWQPSGNLNTGTAVLTIWLISPPKLCMLHREDIIVTLNHSFIPTHIYIHIYFVVYGKNMYTMK